MKRLVVALLRAVLGGLGRLAALFAAPVQARVLFVFATPDIGGAERYHRDIVEAVSDSRPQVWFTEVPRVGELLADFQKHATVLLVGHKLRWRICAYFYAGFMGGRIRRGKVGVMLGGFSHFFYDMLRFVGDVRCVDLTHNSGLGFDTYSLRHAPKLAARVVVHDGLAGDIAARYASAGIDVSLGQRIRVIGPGVDVPQLPPTKDAGPLCVLYVGRDSPEKRVGLVGSVAAKLAHRRVAARVQLVGVTPGAVDSLQRPYCTFEGMVSDRAQLAAIYDAAHVLVLTSEREGFPLVLIESMARGVVPICTDVGGIAKALRAAGAGAVVPVEARALVAEMAGHIERLATDRPELWAQSRAAHAYALRQFGMSNFARNWREVLLGESPSA